MSKKLPLEIQRNYTIIKDDHWSLKCHVCDQLWELKKPKKGEDFHGETVQALLEHAASHPLPGDAEEKVEVVAAPVPPVVIQPPTTNDVHSHITRPNPTPHVSKPKIKAGPLTYKVEWYGNSTFCHMMKVSSFRESEFSLYDYVQTVTDNHYQVIVRGANQKHARLMGERLIKKHFNKQKEV